MRSEVQARRSADRWVRGLLVAAVLGLAAALVATGFALYPAASSAGPDVAAR